MLTTTLRLQPTPDAPAKARDRVARVARFLPGERLDDAVLMTSELVTNAVRHGSGIVTVAIDDRGGCLSVAVADESPRRPVVRDADLDAGGGRGLQLVRALANAWGVRPTRDGVGKVVWFRVA